MTPMAPLLSLLLIFLMVLYTSGFSPCQTGQYFDGVDCISCHLSCGTCSGPLYIDCTSCVDGLSTLMTNPGWCQCLIPVSGSGICSCSVGNIWDKKTQTCLSCSGINQCQCPQTTYVNYATMACELCDSSCATCVGPLANNCVDCPSKKYLTDYADGRRTCTSSCPTGFFKASDPVDLRCFFKDRLAVSLLYGSDETEYLAVFSLPIVNYYTSISANLITAIRSQGNAALISNQHELIGDNIISFKFDFQIPVYPSDILIIGFDGKSGDDSVGYLIDQTVVGLPMREFYDYSFKAQLSIEQLAIVNKVRRVSNEIFSQVSALALQGVHSTRSKIIQSTLNSLTFMNVNYPPCFAQFTSASFGQLDIFKPKRLRTWRLLQNESQVSWNDIPVGVQEITGVDKYISDQNFFSNLGPFLLNIAISFFLVAIFDCLLYICLKREERHNTWYFKFMKKGSFSLRWSYLLNQYMSGYQDLAFFSFLEVYNALVKGKSSENLTFGFIGIIFVLSGLFGLLFLVRNVYRNLKDNNEEATKEESAEYNSLQRIKVLYDAYRRKYFIQLLYPLMLMLRGLLSSLIIVFLFKSTIVQLVFFNVTSFLMIVYLIKYKPLEEKSQLALSLAYEILFLIALLGVTILHIYTTSGGEDITTRSALGLVYMLAVDAMLLLNIIGFCLEIREYVMIIWRKIKFYTRKRIVPVPLETPRKNSGEITSSQNYEGQYEKDKDLTNDYDAKSKSSFKLMCESPSTSLSPSFRNGLEEENSPNKAKSKFKRSKIILPSNPFDDQPIVEDLVESPQEKFRDNI